MLDVTLVPVLNDNYAYILQSGSAVAVLDPGEADPVIHKLEELGLTPSIIFNTHHHYDHIDGNKKIREKYNAEIIAPKKEQSRIENISRGVEEGDTINFGDEAITVLETPGHTSGHVCFWFKGNKVLFSGDTLFAMGCGRLFEGTAEQMFQNFKRFNDMPDETAIYCGHEYTQDNGRFCLSVDPDNPALIKRMKEIETIRNNKQPTLPSLMGEEKKTNIFMKAQSAQEFAKFRQLKDKF